MNNQTAKHMNVPRFNRILPIGMLTLTMLVLGGCDGCSDSPPGGNADAETGGDAVVEASVDFWAVNGEETVIGMGPAHGKVCHIAPSAATEHRHPWLPHKHTMLQSN